MFYVISLVRRHELCTDWGRTVRLVRDARKSEVDISHVEITAEEGSQIMGRK